MTKFNISFHNEPKNVRETLNSYYNDMIGKNLRFKTLFGEKPCIYADFTATSRPCKKVENHIRNKVLPYYSNIHSGQNNFLNEEIKKIYEESKTTLRKYVNADDKKDKIIFTGQGTTSAINKFVSMLRLREYSQFYEDLIKIKKIYEISLELNQPEIFEKVSDILTLKENFKRLFPQNRIPFNALDDVGNLYNVNKKNFIYYLMEDSDLFKPIVFYSYMEHNSNFLPWLIEGVEMIQIKNYNDLQEHLRRKENSYIKIGTFTAASNITGQYLDVDKLAILMHYYGGIACFDYATAAPYLAIDMNSMLPDDYRKELGFSDDIDGNIKKYCYKDAVFFSPHHFLAGNNTPGVLICKEKIINNLSGTPSQPGGGTALFVRENKVWYHPEVEIREEGGTPDIIGSVRVGMTISMRNRMNHLDVALMNKIINDYVRQHFNQIENLKWLKDFGDEDTPHLPIYSFLISYGEKYYHPNFISSLLNDLFGIQTHSGSADSPLYTRALFGIEEDDGHCHPHLIRNNLDNYNCRSDGSSNSNRSSNKYPKQFLQRLEYYSTHEQAIYNLSFTRINFPYFYPKFIIDYILYAVEFVARYAYKFLPFYKFDMETGHYYICNESSLKQKQHHSHGIISSMFSRMKSDKSNEKDHVNLSNFQIFLDSTKLSVEKLLNKVDSYVKSDKVLQENMVDQDLLFTIESNHYRWFIIFSDIKTLYEENNKTHHTKKK